MKKIYMDALQRYDTISKGDVVCNLKKVSHGLKQLITT